MLKYMFERQYGEIEYSFYLQGDVEKQIVFIDDVELIESDKARKNLIKKYLIQVDYWYILHKSIHEI